MESGSLEVSRIHILRIDPGEDVLECVQAFLVDKAVNQAVVLGGYGTLDAHHLHWVRDNRLPAANLYERGEGGIEILSMSGLVVEGQAHIHVTLSTPKGAYGGHLEPGCVTYVLCEIFFAEVAGLKLSKQWMEVEHPGMGKGSVPRLTFDS